MARGKIGHFDAKATLTAAIERAKAPGTCFLWAHSATMNSANSSVGNFLRECSVLEQTTVVRTNCDRVRSDDVDVPHVHPAAALVRDNVPEHSRAVKCGWHCVCVA
jgi:hypothetical protein